MIEVEQPDGSAQKYRLHLRMEISSLDQQGFTYSGQGLVVEDRLTVSASSFMELAAVLSRFHELAEMIRKERERAAE